MRPTFLFAAAILSLSAPAALADLIPPPGWVAHKIVGSLAAPLQGLALDPVTHDAFVGDRGEIIWRITPDGAKTLVVQDQGPGDFINVNAFAFDPVQRVLYVPGNGVVRRYGENGGLLGEETIVVSGVGLGSDGAIYGTVPFSGATNTSIARRDPNSGIWSTWAVLQNPYSTANPYFISVDARGRAFVVTDQGLLRVDATSTIALGGALIRGGVASGPTSVMFGNFGFDPNGGSGGTAFATASSPSDGFIYGVAWAPDGSLYMTTIGASPGGNGSLWQFVPSATPTVHPTWGAVKAKYR